MQARVYLLEITKQPNKPRYSVGSFDIYYTPNMIIYAVY